MRYLVCGGRNYSDKKSLFQTLSHAHALKPATVLIHGGANGADSMAGEWAKWAGVEVIVFMADWKKYGKAAGPIRNTQMLDEGKPDAVIAFAGGLGTTNMVKQARARGIRVIEIESKNEIK